MRVKLKTLFFSCISSVLFFSCIAQDLSDCPPPVNMQLTFSYRGDTGDPSMFARKIDQVTLMVYNENDKLILNRNINKNELTRHQGANIYLEPGSYRIICWGNTNEFTEFTRCELFTDGRLHHPYFFTSWPIPTNSHLYYGSYTAIVPKNGMVSGDIAFRGAHINVEVYIRDLISKKAENDDPKVEAHNLMPEYDMEMKPAQPFTATYYPETIFNMERNLNQAFFQVLRFSDENPVWIEIKDSTGKSKCRIELKEYMLTNEITVDGKNEATVPILIEYTDLGVEIKLPEWIVNEVDPGTR